MQYTAAIKREIDGRNAANVKATPDGQSVAYVAFKDIVLIGGGHKAEYVNDIANAQSGPSKGTITVDKGSILDKGELTVTGCRGGRAEFEAAIKRFSKKKVVFK